MISYLYEVIIIYISCEELIGSAVNNKYVCHSEERSLIQKLLLEQIDSKISSIPYNTIQIINKQNKSIGRRENRHRCQSEKAKTVFFHYFFQRVEIIRKIKPFIGVKLEKRK